MTLSLLNFFLLYSTVSLTELPSTLSLTELLSSVFLLYFFCISFVFLLYFFCISSVFLYFFCISLSVFLRETYFYKGSKAEKAGKINALHLPIFLMIEITCVLQNTKHSLKLRCVARFAVFAGIYIE